MLRGLAAVRQYWRPACKPGRQKLGIRLQLHQPRAAPGQRHYLLVRCTSYYCLLRCRLCKVQWCSAGGVSLLLLQRKHGGHRLSMHQSTPRLHCYTDTTQCAFTYKRGVHRSPSCYWHLAASVPQIACHTPIRKAVQTLPTLTHLCSLCHCCQHCSRLEAEHTNNGKHSFCRWAQQRCLAPHNLPRRQGN